MRIVTVSNSNNTNSIAALPGASDSECMRERGERILEISDCLLDKIEKSIKELDRCVIKTKEKTKSVEYDSDLKKPISETVEETENIEIIEGMIDKMGLKQLVSTLKDIKDIHMSISSGESDDGEESGVILISDVCEGDDDNEKDDMEAAE